MMLFKDRHDAGLKLSAKLEKYRDQPRTIVLGLARGGVVVAHTVAQVLNLPLDVIVIRKVGAPDQEELAIGAVNEDGMGYLNEGLIHSLNINPDYIRKEVDKQKKAAQQRAALYRKGIEKADIKGQTVIVVDDGIATGASVRAALIGLKKQGAGKIVLAVPVAAVDSLRSLSHDVSEMVCLYAPADFMAVGEFYQKFDQTSDEEVMRLLQS
jgi:putative phosphoribosyl transferase